MTLIVPEFDMSNPMVVADVIAPALGDRLGGVLGNIEDIVSSIQSASQILQSGDGVAISTSMAAVIQVFVGWLRNKSEENAEDTRISMRDNQKKFMEDTPVSWMTRKDVGAKRQLQNVILKRKPLVKMSEMFAQFEPGAVYAFSRLGYDLIRRSFVRTDAANAFDEGQPDIAKQIAALSEGEKQRISCMSNLAAVAGQGCCYYPGERIQFSFGTYPYIHGRSVVDFEYVDPEIPFIRHAALLTPSAHHVMIDEGEVYKAYLHWSEYTRLKDLPDIGKGQKDPGIYRDDQGLPQAIGDYQYWDIPQEGGYKLKVSPDALRDVTAAFYQFFVVRQMVLRQFNWLAPNVKAAAKNSKDERVRKLARGEKVPLWKWDPFDPLLQLEQLPEGSPNTNQGKQAPPKQEGQPTPKPTPTPTPKPTPSGKAKPQSSEETGSLAGVPWVDLGMILAGVGGAAYVGRKDIVRWIREKVR